MISNKYSGVAASPGIIKGPAYIVNVEDIVIREDLVVAEDVESEIARFHTALKKSYNEIREMRDKVAAEDDTVTVDILDAYLLMLEDSMIIGDTEKLIREDLYNAEYATQTTLDRMLAIFNKIEDPYFKERGFDLRDVAYRVIQNLLGVSPPTFDELPENAVIIAHDLSPSQTASIPRGIVGAFVTEVGSRTSHTSIMARSIEIPAVVGVGQIVGQVRAGDTVIVDGNKGLVITNPKKPDFEYFDETLKSYLHIVERRKILSELPAKTIDGFRIELSANIELPEEMEAVIRHGADGVGLYRTEFLMMNRDDLPSEDEQFEVYRSVISQCLPHSAIIRTYDIGGDKFVSQLDLADEINPYLGQRAIRFCLNHTELFLTQLRGILRASAFGKAKIMFPMVSSLNELRQAKGMVELAKQQLDEQSVPYDKAIEIGIMIEVPSAAVIADVLADHCDFFSVGTNDLIQYTLAVDRGNEKVANLYKPFSPSIIRLLYNISRAAHLHGIWVGTCGEMASIPAAAFLLMGMSYDELSVSPIAIEEVKETIRNVRYSDARLLVERAMKFHTDTELLKFLEETIEELGLDLGLT